MADQSWRKLAESAEIPEGALLKRTVGRMEFLVTRVNGQVSVLTNRCPHEGCRLSGGLLRDGVIACPCHGARFDALTGRMLSPPALDDLLRFPVKEEGSAVLVGPPAAGPTAPGAHGQAAGLASAVGGAPGSSAHPQASARQVVIIGGGAAGNACAETLRREGFPGRVLVLTDEADLPCNRPSLSKGLLSGQTPAESLSLRSLRFYEGAGIEVLTGRRVRGLDIAGRRVLCGGGESFPFDSLLIATGASPRLPDIPGLAGGGVFRLQSRADGLALAEAAKTATRAVVIGAGFVGLEAASSLGSRGIEVCVAAPEDLPLEGVFGRRIATGILRLQEGRGVRFALGRPVRELLQGTGRTRVVVFSDGSREEADLVIAGTGVQPASEFLDGSGLLRGGFVEVDRRLSTSVPGIFAAGDVALVPYGRDGRRERVGHWVDAERQGQAAALAMLGGETAAFTEVRFFWTEQWGKSYTMVGTALGREPAEYRGDPEGGEFLAGYYTEGRLTGAAALGFEKQIAGIALALRDGLPVPRETFPDPSMTRPPGR